MTTSWLIAQTIERLGRLEFEVEIVSLTATATASTDSSSTPRLNIGIAVQGTWRHALFGAVLGRLA